MSEIQTSLDFRHLHFPFEKGVCLECGSWERYSLYSSHIIGEILSIVIHKSSEIRTSPVFRHYPMVYRICLISGQKSDSGCWPRPFHVKQMVQLSAEKRTPRYPVLGHLL